MEYYELLTTGLQESHGLGAPISAFQACLRGPQCNTPGTQSFKGHHLPPCNAHDRWLTANHHQLAFNNTSNNCNFPQLTTNRSHQGSAPPGGGGGATTTGPDATPPQLSAKTGGGGGGAVGAGGGGGGGGGAAGGWGGGIGSLAGGGGGAARNPLVSHAYLKGVSGYRGMYAISCLCQEGSLKGLRD